MPASSRLALTLVLALSLLPVAAQQAPAQTAPAFQPNTGLFCNIDSSVFFYYSTIPEGKAGELIDQYVDVMAEAGTSVLLCNTNSRRTNYRSQAWEAHWDGYDSKGPDDQPFLKPVAQGDLANYRRLLDNMLEVYRQGIDYPERMLRRAKQRGMSPWITLRMNDCHYNNVLDHPFHGSFWKKNPQFFRQNAPGYFEHCLDYAHPEVRAFYMALIDETLERYDIEGLDLDFMRECFLFSAGKEAEGAPILTAWMRDVRKRVQEAAARRGHPIQLSVRVPSRPETAQKLGFEIATWVQEGLIDVLVPTPRWATLEFDMPLEQWRTLLGKAPVTLAGGLEINYRPSPGGSMASVTPNLARGAATLVRSRGADAVYLFNYFQDSHPHWPNPTYTATLKSMTSLEALLQQPRTVGITYRDITAPGEAYAAPLPAVGRELAFSMRVGPLPPESWSSQLLLEIVPTKDQPFVAPVIQVNGKPCTLASEETGPKGQRVLHFQLPLGHLKDVEVQQIQLRGPEGKTDAEYRVERVEVSFTPAAK